MERERIPRAVMVRVRSARIELLFCGSHGRCRAVESQGGGPARLESRADGAVSAALIAPRGEHAAASSSNLIVTQQDEVFRSTWQHAVHTASHFFARSTAWRAASGCAARLTAGGDEAGT